MTPEEKRRKYYEESMKRMQALYRQNKPAPKQSLFNKVRDVFDANTEADKFRRWQQGESKNYATQQKERGIGRISNNPWERTINAGRSIAEGLYASPKRIGEGIEELMHGDETQRQQEANNKRLREIINKVQGRANNPNLSLSERAVQRNILNRLLRQQSKIGEEQVQQAIERTDKLDPEKMAAAIADVGLTVASAGVGGFTGKQFGQTLAKQGLRQAAKEAARPVITNTVLNTLQGATGTIAALPVGRDATGKDILLGAAFGGTVGNIADFTLGGIPALRAYRGYGRVLNELAETSDTAAIKSSLKNINTKLDDDAIDAVSERISRASTADQVDEILQQAAEAEYKTAASKAAAETAQTAVGETADVTSREIATQGVSEDLVKQITNNRNVNQIAESIRALFPELDDATSRNIVSELAQSTDEKTTMQILEQAQARRASVEQAVDQAAPQPTPEPASAEQQVAEATRQQTAPAMSSQVPEQQAVQVTQPAVQRTAEVPGATTIQDIPGTFPADAETKARVAGLVEEAKKNPIQPNTTRLYQGTENGQPTDWYFATPEELAQYYGNRSSNVDFNYRDVPNSQLAKVEGRPGTYRVSEDPVDTIEQAVQAADAARNTDNRGKFKKAFEKLRQELVGGMPEYRKMDNELAKYLNVREQDLDPARSQVYLWGKVVESPAEAARIARTATSTGESLADVMLRNQNNENAFMQYLNQKFALEIYDKSGNSSSMWKVKGSSPEQVARSVAEFEAKNPQVVKDAATVKAWADLLLDKGVEAGEISKEFADEIKNKYQNYVPLSKVYDDAVVRPTVQGGIGTSVGRQNVVRLLGEGGTEYDDTFAALVSRGESVVKKANVNKLNLERLAQAELGIHGDRIKILVNPEQAAERQAVIQRMKELREQLGKSTKERAKLATKKRLSKAELTAAQTEAAERMRQYYTAQSQPGKAGWVNKLSRAELLDMFDVAVEASDIKAKRIIKKLAKRGGQYEDAALQLAALRDDIKGTRGDIQGLFNEAAGLNQKAGTNKNLVKGFRDGNQFVMEFDAPLAKQDEYLNTLYDDTVGRISAAIAAPLKATYTGFLAPVFAAKQVVKQQGTKFIQSEGLSAFGARPLTTGWFGGVAQYGKFYDDLVEVGFKPVTATQVGKQAKITAKQLAASADKYANIKYTVSHPTKWLEKINNFFGRLDTADRVQIAKGEYLRRIRLGHNSDEAMRFAARQANEAIGDFRFASKWARRMESITPYSGATQSGYRALMRRFKTNPIQTSIKLAAVISPVFGAAAYSGQRYKDYYQEMIDNNRTYELDTNVIFIAPGAHKATEEEVKASDGQLKDGDWVGVFKMPVAPDYNPLTRAAWRTGFAIANGQEPDIKMIAAEIKNLLTADQQRGFYEPEGREGYGKVLPGSPVKTIPMTLAGVDPYSGKPLASDRDRTKPRAEQYSKYTTEMAKNVSKAFDGILTPQQIDALANQLGFIGDVAQGKPIKGQFGRAFKGARGVSEGSKFYKDFEDVSRNYFTDDKQWQAWQELHTSRTKKDGGKKESGLLDSARKSMTLLTNEEVLRAEQELNRRNAERSGNSNPLLDDTLTPDQRAKVLTYRSMRINNVAKQSFTKNGESAFISLGLDEPWYQEFKKKEDAYWKKVNPDSEFTPRTFSGQKSPELPKEQQELLDYYYTLPKDTGDRSRFIRANPWLPAYWDAQNNFTNAEREALGFNRLPDYESSYGSGSGYGKRGGFKSTGKSDSGDRQYLTTLIGSAPSGSVDQARIKVTPTRAKLKVKLPKGKGRNYKRIKLQ